MSFIKPQTYSQQPQPRFRVNKVYNRLTVSSSLVKDASQASRMDLEFNPAARIVRIRMGADKTFKTQDYGMYVPGGMLDKFGVELMQYEVPLVYDDSDGWWYGILDQAVPYQLKKNQRAK